ncbi:phage major capsid protein [Methylorubrum rhodesianum]|uniref:phage major capsid protein n=1 Tax=Methylorubrum rhodesianum TaxID=29427 RepID=UPI003D26E5D7
MRIHELREQKANRVAEMRGLVNKAEGEKRDLNEQERSRFDTLKGEVSGLETRIGQAETLAAFERGADAEPVTGHGGMADLEARYSLGRAVAEFLETGRLTGAEGEYAREIHRESRSGGRANSFAAPVSAFLGGEQRYIGTQTPAAGPGGNLVPTHLGPLIDRPRPMLQVQRLGATVLTGLTANLDLPRLKTSGNVGWVNEHQEGPQTDPTFDKVEMGPHTVTGSYEMSRRMMLQAPQVEQILRQDIGWQLAQALDLSALYGLGTGGMPHGIRGVAGVEKITFGAGRTSQAWIDATASMIGAIDAANITGGTGFLTSPQVRGAALKLTTADGMPIGVPTLFHNERVEFSTQVPANGGASTDLSAIFYGSWSDLIIGYWSSVDIVLNPYADSVAKKGGALLSAFLDADVALRHPESFAWADDVPTAAAA